MSWATLARLSNDAGTRVFGQACTYTPASGSAVSIRAVLDWQDDEVASVDSDGTPVLSQHPVVDVTLADLASEPVEGDVIAFAGGETYRVREVRRSSAGFARLYVTRVS